MSEAALRRAAALRAAGRWAESARQLEPVIRAQPNNVRATYYYAMALLETGRASAALPHFKRMLASDKHVAEARFMAGRCYMEQNQADDARASFHASHALKPTHLTLRALSNLDWMEGRLPDFRRRLETVPPHLAIPAYGLWIESEDFDAADAVWRRLDVEDRNRFEALALRAHHMRQVKDAAESLAAAQAAARLAPNEPAVIDALATGYLMCGDANGAYAAIMPARRSMPENQHWIAHEATALQLMGDQRAEALLDTDRLVRAYTLECPDGYSSLEVFNRALQMELDEHHRFAKRPLNQSLRGGSQTAQDLLAMGTPAVMAYLGALRRPISAYLADIGAEPGHPLTSRNTGRFKIKGCWSVRLERGGHHVNHVHPEGWISSAYYVAVPDQQTGKGGWIKFGEPPFQTEPALDPLKWIEPKPGLLALFPSYMWHGTHPIGDGGPRITAPFDVVPA